MDKNLLNIFKSAFNVEIENRVEVQDNSLIVYLPDSMVVVDFKEMFKL